MKIILINGPPRAGKDTAANVMMRNLRVSRHHKLSAPLKSSIATMFRFTSSEALDIESNKDVPLEMFHGRTYRQAQIAQFEMLEKHFGPKILGELAVKRMRDMAAGHVIISDAGRDDEIIPLKEQYGSKAIYYLFISRPGCTFNNDIRHKLRPEQFMPSHVASIENIHDRDLYESQVLRVLKKWELIQ